MALALPDLQFNGSDESLLLQLPSFEFNGSDDTLLLQLPTWQFSGTDDTLLLQLPTFQFTEQIPSSLTVTPGGGFTLGGDASIVGDPLIKLVGSGGARLGGGAAISFANIAISEHYPRGGAAIGGAATVGWNWKQLDASGGVAVGGAAIVLDGNVAAIGARLPKLRGSLTNSYEAGSATLAVKLKPVQSTFTGLLARTGTISGALPKMTANASAGITQVKAGLPALTARLDAQISPQAVIVATLPRFVASIFAQAAATAAINARLALPRAAISGLAGVSASLAARLPALVDAVAGSAGTIARLSVTISAPQGAARGFARVSGTIAVGLPRLRTALSVRLAVQQALTQVTNLITHSAVLYEQYPFNSFAEFGGRYLAAGQGGLYQIDSGDTDTSAPIAARFKSGESDFGSEFIKSVPYFYCAMRATGDLTLRVFVDETDPVEYALSPHDIETLRQRRSEIGKGLRGKYWAFEVENTGGCDFDLDTMNVMVIPARRRI